MVPGRERGKVGGDADGYDDDASGERGAGGECEAELGAEEGGGESGFDGGAENLAGVGVEAGGDVEGEDGLGRVIDEVDGATKVATDFAMSAGAEEGVDDKDGGGEGFGEEGFVSGESDGGDVEAEAADYFEVDEGVAGDLVEGGEDEGVGEDAGVVEMTGEDVAVAAVVATTGEDDDGTGRVTQHLQGEGSGASAGILHEDDAGKAEVFDGTTVDFANGVRREGARGVGIVHS